MKTSVLILMLLLLTACASNNNNMEDELKEERQPKEWTTGSEHALGQYVYVDTNGIVHSVLNGVGCGLMPVANGENMSDLGMYRISVDTLQTNHIGKCCRICVPDAVYKQILEKIEFVANGDKEDLTSVLYE